MRATLRPSLRWLAGALGLALLVGPVVGQAAEAPERTKEYVTLRVPVQIKKAVAKSVRVDCVILRGQLALSTHKKSDWHDIKNGEFNQVIELVMTPSPGKTFVGTDQYGCHLEISSGAGAWGNGRQGTPSGPEDPNRWELAKPDQFFRSYSSGSLESGKVDGGKKTADGIVGPKDITIGPNQKEH